MKFVLLCLVIFLSISLISMLSYYAGADNDELAAVRKAIGKGNAIWIEAFRRSDAELIVSVFSEDGAILSSSSRKDEGKEAIVTAMEQVMASFGPTETTIETLNIWLEGDTAYEAGKYSYRFTPEGREEQVLSGKYLVIWKRQPDGAWKIYRDIGLPD